MKNYSANNQGEAGTLAKQAVAYFQQGDLAKAQTFAERALRLTPDNAEANHLLGIIKAQQGQFERAEELIARATRQNPKYVEAYISYGNVLRALQLPKKALMAYKRAIQLQPRYAITHYNKGNVLKDLTRLEEALASYDRSIQLGLQSSEPHINRGAVLMELNRPKEALAAYNRAVRINPRSIEAHNNRGAVLSELGLPNEALAAYEQAIQLDPESADAHYNCGILLRIMGFPDKAISAYDRAIQINPAYIRAYINRSNLLKETGRFNEALEDCARAIEIAPRAADIHYNRGNLLRDLGRQEEALAAYDQAVRLSPGHAQAHGSRGFILWELWRLYEALEAFKQSIALDNRSAEAHAGLANVLWELCYTDEAEHSYRRALKLKPDYHEGHSNLLFLLAATAKLDPDKLLAEQKSWDRIHGEEGRKRSLAARKTARGSTEGRLRVGYVSPDFRKHAVSYFFEPLLAAHDRSRFEIFCYASHPRQCSDSTTDRLRNLSERWRFVSDRDDEGLARLIHEDGIDVLVDLAGHTANNRLKTFTYRPAPVQATYLGFIGASGLANMDYWITDETLHPPDTPEQSVENIYRLHRCSFCYQPPAEAPAVSPRPIDNDAVVFGSFCNLSKLTPELIETWSQLLHKLPKSRLLLMSKPLSELKTRQLVFDRFTPHNINLDRIFLQKIAPLEEYFTNYAKVDIVLDSFPRTGGTTTAEALWMGIPVITLAGQRYAERISASKLTAVGLKELITYSREEYIEKALLLAHKPEWRAQLRANLRQNMAQSQLCDGESLARALEQAYLSMTENFYRKHER